MKNLSVRKCFTNKAQNNYVRTMKLTAFFLFLFIFQVHAGISYSQTVKLSIDMVNAPLEEVIDRIEKETGFHFVFTDKAVDTSAKVSIRVSDEVLSTILEQLVSKVGLKYHIVDRLIVLSPQTSLNIQQGSPTIKGTVTDTSGDPIIGANILEKGTTNGTISDVNGDFTLQITSTDAVLLITYIGYFPQEIKVGNQTSLQIRLQEDTQTLDEVVVVGYGVQKKSNLTGALSVADMDKVLGNRPVTSVAQALEGAVPGLQITTDNASPGASSTIKVRGVTNITGAEPLVLMDNVPVDINTINPNDIESVTVLKDASSAAIYGARAAYGVILLTGKKGIKSETPRFSYSTNLTVSRPYQLISKASPYETVNLLKDAGYSTYWSGQQVDKWLEYLDDYQANPSKYPDGYIMDGSTPYQLRNNNLVKDMIEKVGGFEQIHNLSVTGGTERTAYRFSVGYTDQDGVLVTDADKYNRLNISSFLSSDLTKWFTAQLTVNYSKGKRNQPNTNSGSGGELWSRLNNIPGYAPLGYFERDGETYPFRTPRHLLEYLDPVQTNTDVFRALGKAIFTPFKDFRIVGEFTYDKKNVRKDRYDKKVTFVECTNFLPEATRTNSYYQKDVDFTEYMAANIYASYEKSFNDAHNIAATVGFNTETSHYEKVWISKTDMINPDLPSISSATGTLDGKDSYSEYAILGAFYRVTYDYKGRYLLEANGRYDGSSRFPRGHRFGFFPSFSGAWRISEEPFMKEVGFLSNLKLRASYGNIGNQAIPPYKFLTVMNPSKSIWLGDGESQYWTLGTPGIVSQSFTWEKVQNINGGIDIGLFKNRLNMSFDYYIRQTKDMFGPSADLPDVLGTTAPSQNSADLKTKGWEIQVDWRDKIGDVGYSIGFNLFDSYSKITRFENATGNLANNWDTDGNGEVDSNFYTGKKLGEIWGYVTDRYYTVDDFEPGSLDANLKNGKLKSGIPFVKGTAAPNPGDVLYKDLDNSGDISQDENTVYKPGDRKVIGNNTPRYHFGITGSLNWKDFDFSFFIQGVAKRDIWARNSLNWPMWSEFSAIHSNTLDYWMPDRTDASFPRIYQRAGENTERNHYVQTKYLQNGAYWRLKNVTIGYTLPAEWMKRIRINNARVFISGENLFTKHHLAKGLDPEMGNGEVAYPVMSRYSFGLHISF